MAGPREHVTPIRVMIVEDHPVVAEGLAALLADYPDLEVVAGAALLVEDISRARGGCDLHNIATGAAAGMSAAYLRGASDGFIMRTVDVILAFPQLVFALLLCGVFPLVIFGAGQLFFPRQANGA